MDYFFLTEEDKANETNPMMIMKDESTGERYARIVEHKGLREGEDGTWIVSDMVRELRAWGHQGGEGGHIIVKSDGEPTMKAVMDAVAQRLGGRVIPERPAQVSRRVTARRKSPGRQSGRWRRFTATRWRQR